MPLIPVTYPDDIWDPNGWAEPVRFQSITLNDDGDYCLVDSDKYDELLAEGPWHLFDYRGKRYAKRTRRRGERYSGVSIYMHRVLAERYLPKPSPKHILVDHKRSNGLDNRLHMLRWATPWDNRMNVYGMWWQQRDFWKELDASVAAQTMKGITDEGAHL